MGGSALLMVLFWTGGQPYFLDGWHPIEQPSIAVCEERAEDTRAFLERNSGWPRSWTVMCVGSKEEAGAR